MLLYKTSADDVRRLDGRLFREHCRAESGGHKTAHKFLHIVTSDFPVRVRLLSSIPDGHSPSDRPQETFLLQESRLLYLITHSGVNGGWAANEE